MKNSGHRSRAGKLAASTAVIGAMSLLPVAPALAVDSTFPEASITAAVAAAVDTAAAAEALAATPWRTTGAVDQVGAAVDLADARAAAFVGDAYFKADGTFAMYELSGAPKMHGLWEMREVDGTLVRWIRALDDAGATRFERIVEIVRLDGSEFTYRVSNADDASQWVDIVHTPMSDPEPGTETGEGDIEDEEATEDETVVEDETPAGGGTGTESGTPESGATDDLTGSATDGTPTNATTTSLPNTGGLNAMSALAGSIVAVLSGAAVLIGRAIRRRTN